MSDSELTIEIDVKTALKVIWCASEKVFPDLPDYHPNTAKLVELAKKKFFPMLDEMLKLDNPWDYEKSEEFDEVCDKITELINEISEDMKND